MFVLPITLAKTVVSLGSLHPLFSSARGPLSYTLTVCYLMLKPHRRLSGLWPPGEPITP